MLSPSQQAWKQKGRDFGASAARRRIGRRFRPRGLATPGGVRRPGRDRARGVRRTGLDARRVRRAMERSRLRRPPPGGLVRGQRPGVRRHRADPHGRRRGPETTLAAAARPRRVDRRPRRDRAGRRLRHQPPDDRGGTSRRQMADPGRETLYTCATAANFHVVYAITGPGRLGCFIVEPGRRRAGPPLHPVGLKGCGLGQVTFDHVTVPDENVLGLPGAGATVFQAPSSASEPASARSSLGDGARARMAIQARTSAASADSRSPDTRRCLIGSPT